MLGKAYVELGGVAAFPYQITIFFCQVKGLLVLAVVLHSKTFCLM